MVSSCNTVERLQYMHLISILAY